MDNRIRRLLGSLLLISVILCPVYYYSNESELSLYLTPKRLFSTIMRLSEYKKYLRYDLNSWIPIPGALLRSAYFDERGTRPVVRILAYMAQWEECNYNCTYVTYSGEINGKRGQSAEQYSANCVVINSNIILKPIFFECPPPQTPISTTLVTIQSANDTSDDFMNRLMPIVYQKKTASFGKKKLVSCVSPLYNWHSTEKLFLFINYYKMQGADYFIIYNHSSDNASTEYLSSLEREELVKVVPWTPLPDVPLTNGTYIKDAHKKVYYYGQILASNECVLNGYIWGATFTLTVDLDEFIWPQEENETLIALLNQWNRPTIGSFDIRTARVKYEPNAIEKMGNKSAFAEPGSGNKQALIPMAIYAQTVHLTWEYFPGFSQHEVPPEKLQIYHLRDAQNVIEMPEFRNFAAVLKSISSNYSASLNKTL